MKEGQGAAPAPAPWDSADAATRVPARPSADTGSGAAAEPHARVDGRKLETALLQLRDAAGRTQLILDCPGVEEARAGRQHVISQVEVYLLPPLHQSRAPILIALVRPDGA